MAASVVGRLADRDAPRWTILAGQVLMTASFGLFWPGGYSLVWLAVGVVLMDLGAQATHFSNQVRIYAIRPEARNRMNTGYLVTYFVGGSAGSALGAYAWGRWGWAGVCGTALGMLGVALAGFAAAASRRLMADG